MGSASRSRPEKWTPSLRSFVPLVQRNRLGEFVKVSPHLPPHIPRPAPRQRNAAVRADIHLGGHCFDVGQAGASASAAGGGEWGWIAGGGHGLLDAGKSRCTRMEDRETPSMAFASARARHTASLRKPGAEARRPRSLNERNESVTPSFLAIMECRMPVARIALRASVGVMGT